MQGLSIASRPVRLKERGAADGRDGTTARRVSWERKSEALAKQFEVKARDGRALDGFSLDRIDEMNAQHAKDYANCTRAETIELHKKGVVAAAATIRGVSDEDLARTARLAAGAPPMTVEQIITGGLLHHVDDHFGSIRKTIG